MNRRLITALGFTPKGVGMEKKNMENGKYYVMERLARLLKTYKLWVNDESMTFYSKYALKIMCRDGGFSVISTTWHFDGITKYEWNKLWHLWEKTMSKYNNTLAENE